MAGGWAFRSPVTPRLGVPVTAGGRRLGLPLAGDAASRRAGDGGWPTPSWGPLCDRRRRARQRRGLDRARLFHAALLPEDLRGGPADDRAPRHVLADAGASASLSCSRRPRAAAAWTSACTTRWGPMSRRCRAGRREVKAAARAFVNELCVRDPVGFLDPVCFTKDGTCWRSSAVSPWS